MQTDAPEIQAEIRAAFDAWARFPEGWRIVAAHVSVAPASLEPGAGEGA